MQIKLSKESLNKLWVVDILSGKKRRDIYMRKSSNVKGEINSFISKIDKRKYEDITLEEVRQVFLKHPYLRDMVYDSICSKYKLEEKPQTVVFFKNSMLKLSIDDSQSGTIFIKMPFEEFSL